jgi:hypothetical protein
MEAMRSETSLLPGDAKAISVKFPWTGDAKAASAKSSIDKRAARL